MAEILGKGFRLLIYVDMFFPIDFEQNLFFIVMVKVDLLGLLAITP